MQSGDFSLQFKFARLGLQGNSLLIFCIYYSISTPLLEEAYWRGILASTSKRLAWPDIFFAGYHILVLALFAKPVFVIVSFLILLITAWVWRLIAIKLKGLLLPILTHLSADVSIIIAIYILIR